MCFAQSFSNLETSFLRKKVLRISKLILFSTSQSKVKIVQSLIWSTKTRHSNKYFTAQESVLQYAHVCQFNKTKLTSFNWFLVVFQTLFMLPYTMRFFEHAEFGVRDTLYGAPNSLNWHENRKNHRIWLTKLGISCSIYLFLCDCEHLNCNNNSVVRVCVSVYMYDDCLLIKVAKYKCWTK